MIRGEGVAAVVWVVGAGLVLGLAGACGDKEQQSASGDDGGFYDGGAGDGGEGADGADGADGATDGGEGTDGGDGASDGGLDEGGTSGGGGSVDGDEGWDDSGDGGSDGEVSPTPVWEPDLAVSCEGTLDFQLHVIDSSARPCTDACASGEIWLGGAIVNPCDEPLTVTLDGGMVISGGSVESPSGEGMGWAGGSDGSVTTMEIAPGGFIQGTESIGELGAGDWVFSINFGDPDRHSLEAERTLR